MTPETPRSIWDDRRSDDRLKRQALRTYYEHTAEEKHYSDHILALNAYLVKKRATERQVRSYLRPGSAVLDLGCGDGLVSRDLGEFAVLGADISSGRLVRARHHFPVVACEATSLPFKSDTFHGVLCSELIEHLPHYEVALQETARVLKQGGYLFLSTPTTDNLRDRWRRRLGRKPLYLTNPEHLHAWSRRELSLLLEARHLRVVAVKGVYFFLFNVPFIQYQLRRSPRLMRLLAWWERKAELFYRSGALSDISLFVAQKEA